jgi:hypothetical protein
MFTCIHNRKYFYKYVTAEVAEKILSTLEVRWSSPILFNDPFDTQQDFNPDDDSVLQVILDAIEEPIFQENDPDYSKMDYMTATKLKLMRDNRSTLKPEEWREEMQKYKDEIITKFRIELERLSKTWRDCCADDRIFCVVEDNDNLLMWAHYADHHRGAVIKLKCIPELDTVLCAAIPILYSREMPLHMLTKNYRYNQPIGQELVQKLFYVKSIDWSYEKEWRVVCKKRKNGGQDYDMNNIHKEEIEAVYFGCRMSEDNKGIILRVIDTQMKHVKVFQSCKNKLYFKLDFLQIK